MQDIVTSTEHVLALLAAGEQARKIGETRMNKASSRSHTVFRMVRAFVGRPRPFCSSCKLSVEEADVFQLNVCNWRGHVGDLVYGLEM